MQALIAATFARARTAMLLLALLLVGGIFAYLDIAKEAAPEIDIPLFMVTVTYPGISAEDSARVLIQPIERRLQSIDGLREITGQAGENFASIRLRFHAGTDQDRALQDVRDAVETATPDLPADANDPVVREIDMSLFPILTVALSGPVPERDLMQMGRDLADRIEGVSGVLEARISGDREDLVEIVVDPLAMQSYGISVRELAQAVQANNQLVPAGAFDTGAGRIAVAIPGRIASVADVLAMPVRVAGGIVVRVRDVAEVRETFRDAVTFARLNGQPMIGIDVTKVAGANVLDTVARVREVVEETRAGWPEALRLDLMQDQGEDIAKMLGDLENSVILAVLMVMLPTILVLGLRASFLIGISIPASFFGGILIIWLMGFTINIVVLFGLILVIGMLVDGSMVVVEKAERLQAEGMAGSDAFRASAQRMAWSVISAIATSLAVFFPLLFWPGTAGRFMVYLPATVLVTLLVSLVVALVFVPVVGGLLSRGRPAPPVAEAQAPAFYGRILDFTIARPGFTLGLAALGFLLSLMAFSRFGTGVEFFPAVEPSRAQIQIRANGNLSVQEADRLVGIVENRVIGTPGVDLAYARTIGSVEERLTSNLDPDVIGTIQMDLDDWRTRPPATEIVEELRRRTAEVPGLGLQVEEQRVGLGSARPVQVELTATDTHALQTASEKVIAAMETLGGFTEIVSDVPTPGMEARLAIDREQAARNGVDVSTLGAAVRLLTGGVTLSSWLPQHLDEEVDIVLRFPAQDRNLTQLAQLRVMTTAGPVPASNFVTLIPSEAPALISWSRGKAMQTISSALAPGLTVSAQLSLLEERLSQQDLGPVTWRFPGEIEDQQETAEFLILALVLAAFLMFMVMLTQLNSFYQSLLVVSAIVCSIPGVLIVLMLTGAPFSMVMGGMGVMALAGVVVNNNIILIDAYNEHRAAGLSPDDAARRAAGERLRPILLTAVTTITGLLPMAIGLTVDFMGRDAYFGAPSGQFWVQLSMTIVGGLLVGTVITSCLTPTLLAWDGRRRERR